MNEEINLLEPNKNSAKAPFFHRLHMVRVLTIGLLFVVSVTSVIIFILVALSPLPALQRQEQSLKSTLAQSQKDIIKLALLNERLGTIHTILAGRQTYDEPLNLIQSKLTSDLTMTAVQTDKKSITITIQGSSLKSLDDFLNSMIAYVQSKKVFSNITLINLTNSASADTFAVTAQLTLL